MQQLSDEEGERSASPRIEIRSNNKLRREASLSHSEMSPDVMTASQSGVFERMQTQTHANRDRKKPFELSLGIAEQIPLTCKGTEFKLSLLPTPKAAESASTQAAQLQGVQAESSSQGVKKAPRPVELAVSSTSLSLDPELIKQGSLKRQITVDVSHVDPPDDVNDAVRGESPRQHFDLPQAKLSEMLTKGDASVKTDSLSSSVSSQDISGEHQISVSSEGMSHQTESQLSIARKTIIKKATLRIPEEYHHLFGDEEPKK